LLIAKDHATFLLLLLSQLPEELEGFSVRPARWPLQVPSRISYLPM
jgi:hypothetical protein